MRAREAVRQRLAEARPTRRLLSIDGGPRVSPAQRLMELAIRPLVAATMHRDYRGMEHVPPSGGVIVAGNHVSDVDPFVLADFLLARGRHTHFLAKHAVFAVPGLGWFLHRAMQISVRRDTVVAGKALTEAARAVRAGAAVALYPEGKESLDPTNWPMTAQSGVAALALSTGAPVIPVVQWGTQDIRGHRHVLRLLPRAAVTVAAAEPVDLGRWHGQPFTPEVLQQASDQVMAAVVDLESKVRHERPPLPVRRDRPGWPPAVAKSRHG
jgi:1-acyl-sn-glycerol-3-phosphate acyltransferase